MRVFATLPLAAALLASTTNAAIALGHNGADHLMWVEGKGTCTGKVISPIKDSRCGPAVKLDDGNTFTVKGCPKDLEVVGDGNTFSGKCHKLKVAKKEKCGFHTHVCGADQHEADGDESK